MAPKIAPYATYDEVPALRKQWFFWLTWFAFPPIAIGLLWTGDVYYWKKGEVRAFGMANRIVAGLIALLWLAAIMNAIAGR
ncbi:MAG TPA: hypothetical protein VEU55_03610 [Gemmatimonadales bacterium]|nr:hypothetical protein [Gemmatimonadales bacterium]